MNLKDEKGQALVYAIIFLVVGSLLMASLVPFLGAGTRRQLSALEQVMAGYAAEAGVNRIIADLIRGVDVLSPHYTVPEITVNRHTPTVEIRAATIARHSERLYIDPGVRDLYLSAIPAGRGYLMRLHHVKPGELTVNWAYSPAGLTKLGIWRGITPQGAGRIDAWPEHEAPLAMAESSEGFNRISVEIENPGIYTIVFFNPLMIEENQQENEEENQQENEEENQQENQQENEQENEEIVWIPNSDKVTNPFRPLGGSTYTWIYVRAYQDYVITAIVGGVSVSALVRQVPGFSEPHFGDRGSWITNEVSIYSWRPP